MPGTSNLSGDESIIYADNASFDGTPRGGKLTDDLQLWVGSTSGKHVRLGTLVAGTGVSITETFPSATEADVTFAVTGGGFAWTDVSGAVNAAAQNGYFVTATCTSTLPASPSQGDTIKYFVDTTDILTIQASGSQIIRYGTSVSSSGGTIVSTLQGDSIELVYRSSDTCWCAISGYTGIWTNT